jgi:HEPN domain-containing protein
MRETVDAFIVLAREDLAVAHEVVDELPRDAAFHIEKAAEKLLKAVLTAERHQVRSWLSSDRTASRVVA